MNGRVAVVVLCVFTCGVLPAVERRPYSRYEGIVARAPFGAPPANFDPSVNPGTISARDAARAGKQLSVEQEHLKRVVKFSVINLDPGGVVRVGFSDMSSAKMPRHYYLAVGESRDGWTVAAADAAMRTAKVEKDGVELELTLGGESAGTQMAKTDSPAHRAGVRTLEVASAARPASGGGLTGAKTRSRQRRLLQAEERAQREAEQKKREEKADRERENMREDLAALREQLREVRQARIAAKAEDAGSRSEVPADAAESGSVDAEGADAENAE